MAINKTARFAGALLIFCNVTLKRGDKVILENFSLNISGGTF
ncbi:hypothetical protein CGCVW01_v006692 [Colletotrichum viniferum]|nr:hypothetical protein CGCVW01_v006692 [Colletotrichum viniferum]